MYALNSVKFFHAGRGTGKSHVIGFSAYEKVRFMPRSLGLMTASTVKQFKEKTMSVIQMAWTSLGLEDGIDYVTFKKKPEHWPAPYAMPKDSENVIWFANGTAIQVVGSTQYDAARGGSYDWVEADEIGFFPENFYDDIIIPSLRGNMGRFHIKIADFVSETGRSLDYIRDMLTDQYYRKGIGLDFTIENPLHHQVCLYTSPPRKTKHMWIYKFKELAENDKDFYWLEANAYDNIEAFGERNLRMAKKQMSKRSFEIEMEGKEQAVAELLYYFAFEEKIHGYQIASNIVSRGDELFTTPGAYNTHDILNVSLDFSGWFNGMLVIQALKLKEYIIDSLHVKIESNIDGLIDLFCSKYEMHRNKYVRIYGEPRGHDRRPEGMTLYEQIVRRFRLQGWRCEVLVKNAMSDEHKVRHQIMNEILQETNAAFPILRFNKVDAKDVIKAIKMTEINPDFKKNKSNEKDRVFKQEHAPHYTDALDYYVFQKHSFRFVESKGNGLQYEVL
jgi:hypothetical protein